MSRPWSEWADTPPATWRAKWREAMVPMSAPQMPVFSSAFLPTRRQGPIEQMRQQAPDSPMGHGFMVSARENAVSSPQPSACASISRAAGSMLFAATGLAASVVSLSMRRLLHPRAPTGRDVRAARTPGRLVDNWVSTETVGDQYLRWSPDIVRSAGSVAVTRTPAVSHSGLSVGEVAAPAASPTA